MTIEKIKSNDKPMILVFSATWCGPCKMFSPVFDEVATQMGEYDFHKIDVDECEKLCEELEISTVPAVIIFKNGAEAKRRVGAFPSAPVFTKWINAE